MECFYSLISSHLTEAASPKREGARVEWWVCVTSFEISHPTARLSIAFFVTISGLLKTLHSVSDLRKEPKQQNLKIPHSVQSPSLYIYTIGEYTVKRVG